MDTSDWLTHCVGRFLIDLPAEARLKAGYRIWGNEIRKLPGDSQELHRHLAEREQELEKQMHEAEASMLIRRYTYTNGSASLLSYYKPYSTDAMWLDTYLASPGDESIFERGALVEPSKLGTAVEFAEKLASRVRSRAPHEIPTEPGFCIDGGYIAGSEFMAESFRVGITLPERPDMHMTFRSSTGAEEDTLLERVGGFFRTEVLGRVAGMNTLRKRKRSVGPIAGEEYLVAGGDRQQRMYAFRWEFQGRDGSLAEPNLSLQMGVHERDPDDDGNPPPPAFESDREALELWDAVLESIRLRPGAA